MKKIVTLFSISVLFFSITFLLPSKMEEETQPVMKVETEENYYEVDVNELGLTTMNLTERFPMMRFIRIYPKLSQVYRDRVDQKYYVVDQNKSIKENCSLMQERYLFLLNYYGFVHDKREYEIYGVPISKIIVSAQKEEIEKNLKHYSVKKTVLK